MLFVVVVYLFHMHKFLHHQCLHQLLLMNNQYPYVEYLNDNQILINLDYVLKLNRHHKMHDFVESILIDMLMMKEINHHLYYQIYMLKSPFVH